MLTASSDVQETGYNQTDDDHGAPFSANRLVNMLGTASRKVSGPPDDSASLFEGLPATATLPSLTIDADPLLATAPRMIVKRPRERLATVLRQADRLLREHERVRDHDHRLQKPKVPARQGRMEAFIMSLKDETIAKRQQRSIISESDKMKRRLADLVPTEVLLRRPKLSADNLPGDAFEILRGEDGGSAAQTGKGGDSRYAQGKSSRVTPRAVAPKLKPASIAKLNVELDRKIREQHERDQQGRKRVNSRSRDSIDAEEVDTEGGDEFGEADEGEVRNEGEMAAFEASDLPELTAIEHMPLLPSEDELGGRSVNQPDFGKRRRPRLSLKDEDDDSGEDPLYALDTTTAADSDVRPMELDNAQLSLMLSGQFADKTQGQESEEKDVPSSREDDGEEQEEDDGAATEGEEGLTEKTMIGHHYSVDERTLARGGGFFEEEAEDEDSQVSADDIDEEAIARDLQASRFLVDTTEDEDDYGESGPTLRDSQRIALHRQFIKAEEEEEMQMFMNRFVPEKVLREQGIYAEIRRKYQLDADGPYDDEGDAEEQGRSGRMPNERTKSKFGILPTTITRDGGAQSHPEFLKLIEQDRLSNDEEAEDEGEEGSDQSGQDEIEEGACSQQDESLFTMIKVNTSMESTINTLLEDSSVVISTISTASISASSASRKTGAARGFIRPDESLCGRLMSEHQADGAPTVTQKGNGRTFETVSSRPKISNEKILSKSKK